MIRAKLSKALYILRSAKHLLSTKALKSVYYAIFHSNLIYCLPVWSCTSQANINSLSTMQKAAIRIVSQARFNEHTEPLFKNLKILPLNKLITFFNLQFMQRHHQNLLPVAFNFTWVLTAERRADDYHLLLRNSDNLYIPFARLASSIRQPYIILPKTWREFNTADIKIIRDKSEFNTRLKAHLLDELSSTVNCNRLLCPVCHLYQ